MMYDADHGHFKASRPCRNGVRQLSCHRRETMDEKVRVDNLFAPLVDPGHTRGLEVLRRLLDYGDQRLRAGGIVADYGKLAPASRRRHGTRKTGGQRHDRNDPHQ